MCGDRFVDPLALEHHHEQHRRLELPVLSASKAFENAHGRQPTLAELDDWLSAGGR